MQVVIEIPDGQVPRVVAALIGLHPIPLNDDGDPVCGSAVWAKEVVRRSLVNAVYRYECLDREKAIQDTTAEIEKDETLAGIEDQDPISDADTGPDPVGEI